MKALLKIFLIIIIVLAVIITITDYIGSQEIEALIMQGVLSSDYSQNDLAMFCLLYTSPSPRDRTRSRMPSSA